MIPFTRANNMPQRTFRNSELMSELMELMPHKKAYINEIQNWSAWEDGEE